MIPWCFAYDKVNYERFLSYYYATMSRLPIDHPEVHQQFVQCGFSVQFGSHNPFGHILVDQTIEETVNRDTQTAGGTKGCSLKRAAVTRHYRTSEYRTMYLRQLRKMMGRGMSHLNHADLFITRDEADVYSIIKLLDDDWTNHFVSILAGTLAPPDVTGGILDAHTSGMAAYEDQARPG